MANVSTTNLEPGDWVHTESAGDDFEIPMVKPHHRVKGSTIREVKSVVGGVVRFSDGTKTAKLHGRTAWRPATEEEVILS